MNDATTPRPESLDALRDIAAVPSAARRSALNDLHDNYVQALDAIEALRQATTCVGSILLPDELNELEAEAVAALERLSFIAALLTPRTEQDDNDDAIDRAMADAEVV